MTGARLRHAVRLRVEPSTELRPLLNLDQIESGTGRLLGNLSSSAPSGAIRFEPGDVLFSKLRPYLAKSVLMQASMHGTGELLAMTPGPNIDSRYLMYLTLSTPWLDTASLTAYGAKMPRTSWEVMGDFQLPDLRLDQQRRIADFLDDQVARIDNIIAARRRQIDLIEARRVYELDSLIKADERPAARLALFAHIQSGITVDAGRESVDGIEVPYLRVANVQAGALNLNAMKSIRVARSQVSHYLLRDADVLMTEGGDIDKLGRGTVWRSELSNAIHQNHIFAVRVDQSRLIPEYLAYVTASSPARHYFELTGNRTTNLASTSATKVLDLRIPVRSVDEQARVVDAAEKADARARAGTGLLLDSTARAKELKQSLITSAVTGEFDVSTADGSKVKG